VSGDNSTVRPQGVLPFIGDVLLVVVLSAL
jgi:hypothetical protein